MLADIESGLARAASNSILGRHRLRLGGPDHIG
jgi:hypothetical protein